MLVLGEVDARWCTSSVPNTLRRWMTMKLQVFANIKRKKSVILNIGLDHWDFRPLCTSWRLKVDHGSDDGEFDFRKAIYLGVFCSSMPDHFCFAGPSWRILTVRIFLTGALNCLFKNSQDVLSNSVSFFVGGRPNFKTSSRNPKGWISPTPLGPACKKPTPSSGAHGHCFTPSLVWQIKWVDVWRHRKSEGFFPKHFLIGFHMSHD